MMVHGGIPLGDAWAFLRDHMRPTTPYAAEQLEKCRSYTAPSKAHKRRLLKFRAEISTAKPRVSLDPTARLRHNEAASYGREVAALARVADYRGR